MQTGLRPLLRRSVLTPVASRRRWTASTNKSEASVCGQCSIPARNFQVTWRLTPDGIGCLANCQSGLQPCQLPAPTGALEAREALVADDIARETHQDRGADRPARPVRDFPDGGGGGAEGAVRADPRTDCPAHAAVRHGIVVDGEFLRAPRSPGQGGLRLVLAQYRGPPLSESLRVPRVPLLTPLLRRNMTMASQSGRICDKARLTRRSTGKSWIT